MSLIRSLLGCSSIWENDDELILVSALFNAGGHCTMGTPLIIDAKSNGRVYSVQHFPQWRDNRPRLTMKIETDRVRPMDHKKLFHRQPIEIESFNFDELNNITDKITEEAATTLVLRNHVEIIRFLDKISVLGTNFKYSTEVYSGRTAEYDGMSGDLFLHASFYSPPYIIPIFRKQSGKAIGINIGLCSERKDEKLLIFKEVFLLLSMSDDILVVDGQRIRESGFISSDSVRFMKSIVVKDKKILAAKSTEKQQKDSEHKTKANQSRLDFNYNSSWSTAITSTYYYS